MLMMHDKDPVIGDDIYDVHTPLGLVDTKVQAQNTVKRLTELFSKSWYPFPKYYFVEYQSFDIQSLVAQDKLKIYVRPGGE